MSNTRQRYGGPDEDATDAGVVIDQLQRILANGDFDAAPRCRDLLVFLIEETLASREDGLSDGAIARRVFGRPKGFDPSLDPIVRIQAGQLRRSLERYYRRSGAGDPIRIALPRDTYVPVVRRTPAPSLSHA